MIWGFTKKVILERSQFSIGWLKNLDKFPLLRHPEKVYRSILRKVKTRTRMMKRKNSMRMANLSPKRRSQARKRRRINMEKGRKAKVNQLMCRTCIPKIKVSPF